MTGHSRHSANSSENEVAMTPAAYLRLRRGAARLTMNDAAARLAPLMAERQAAYALLRLWETDGYAGDLDDVARLRTVFPFDITVYRQLLTDPADRHPRICAGCGCTQNDACGDRQTTACHWVAPSLCSACHEAGTKSSTAWMVGAFHRSTRAEDVAA
jgi:hypothetical protein